MGTTEWPRIFGNHAGISGAFAVGEQALRYSASATSLEVDQLTGSIPLGIGQERIIGEAFVEAPLSARFTAGAGAHVGQQELSVEKRERRTARGWIGYSESRGNAMVALEQSAGAATVSGAARHARTLPDSEVVVVSLNVLGSWIDSENSWMDGFGSASAHGKRTTAADLRAEITTHELLKMRPTWYLRGFRFAGFETPATGVASDSSFPARQGAAAGIVLSSAPASRLRVWGRAEVSQLFGEASRGEASMPGGFAEATASATTPGNFALALSARFAPATRWSMTAAPAERELPSTQRLDFSVNKSIWHDRVRAQLVMRNLLNADERTHPLGAQWNLRTHLAVTVALPSGATVR